MLADLREKAERCLRDEAPTASQARELAAIVLASLAHLEGQMDEMTRRSAPDEEHPYRSPLPEASSGQISEIVALERALDEVRSRLAVAEAALAARRS